MSISGDASGIDSAARISGESTRQRVFLGCVSTNRDKVATTEIADGHLTLANYEHLTSVKYGLDTAKNEPHAFAIAIYDFRDEVQINS